MIQIVKDADTRPWFFLQTAHTTYGMRVMETGHLEHLYYWGTYHCGFTGSRLLRAPCHTESLRSGKYLYL